MTVFFIDTVHNILEQRLLSAGFECLDKTSDSKDSILSEGDLAQGIVIRSRIRLDSETLTHFPNLKFIARSGAGLENIDLDYCAANDIRVYNSPEGNMSAVGEHAIGMILSLFNHLKRGDNEVKAAKWNREKNRGLELEGKTVGIFGYGNMGSAFAQRLRGFNCKVMAYDKYKADFGDSDVQEVSMQELFDHTDILSLHIPISEETNYLVNSEFIQKFKNSIYIVNTARGNHINVLDLVKELDSGKVLGACLDVLEYEKFNFETIKESELPSEWSRLVSKNNVILSPHVAGWTKESYVKLSNFFSQ